MNTITDILAVALIAALAGAGIGIYVRGDHDTAKEVKQVVAEQKATAVSIVQAAAVSQQISDKVAANDAAVTVDKAAAHARVVAQVQQATKEKSDELDAQTCGAGYIDLGTLRLLNAARAGTTLQSTSGGNGASEATGSARGSR